MSSVTGVVDAAKAMQAILDEKKNLMEGGLHLLLCNAAQEVYNAAEAFKESGAQSEDEEPDEDDGWEQPGWSSSDIAEQMVDMVDGDENDFADLVSQLHVHSMTRTRTPKASAMAIVRLLHKLDLSTSEDNAKLRKWKDLFVSLDGQGRCGYILKQIWLDDDYQNEEDSDPRVEVMALMAFLAEGDATFRERMVMRGNVRALEFLEEHTEHAELKRNARALIVKLDSTPN